MAEFDDNAQLTRFRQWWSANGTSILIGGLVGIVVIVGWQAWNWHAGNQAAEAASIYQQVDHGVATDQVNDTVVGVVSQLQQDYAGTPYAVDASLRLAGYYVAQQEYDKALELIQWVIDNGNNEGLRHVARVRAARLLWTQEQPDKALELLSVEHPASFDTLYAELAGDIHAAEGDREAAFKSYQVALETLPPDMPSDSLQTKRDDNAPADDSESANAS